MENSVTKVNMINKEVEVLFNKIPESQVLLRQTKYSSYDRQSFESDRWIFGGTWNESDAIMEDIFDTMNTKLPDNKYSQQICAKLTMAYPLKFGEIGGDSLDKKFAGRQSQRQIFEDCTYSNGAVRVPQQTKTGTVSIPSQYRVENISKFANVTLKQASVLSRIYCELGLQFKDVIKFNKIIRRRKVRNPWDIKMNKEGLTLLECAEEMKKLRTVDQEAPDWMHYDDGVFQFKLLDDLGAHSIDELDLSDEVDPLANKPSEFTYWNTSQINLSDTAKGNKTYRQFVKALQAVWNKSVARKKLPALQKYAKRFTPSQRSELSDAIQQNYMYA